MADLTEAASSSAQAGQQFSQDNAGTLMSILSQIANKQGGTVTQTQFPQPNFGQAPVGLGDRNIIPQGSFQSTGEAKRASSEAQIQSLGRIVNTVSKTYHDKKVRGTSQDITRLMEAQNNLEIAKQNKDEDGIKSNISVVNDILMDPKKFKSISKAFGIDPLGDVKKQSSPEYQALLKSTREWKEKGKQEVSPVAQKFMSKLPQGQNLDPRMQQLLSLLKTPGVAAAIREDAQGKTDASRERIQADKDKTLESVTAERDKTRKELADVNNQAKADREKLDLASKEKVAAGKNEANIKATQIRANAILQKANLTIAKIKDPKYNQAYTALTNRAKALQKELDNVSFFDMSGRADKIKGELGNIESVMQGIEKKMAAGEVGTTNDTVKMTKDGKDEETGVSADFLKNLDEQMQGGKKK